MLLLLSILFFHSILNFRMDSASLADPSAPQAVYVEKCSCPQGYTGNSCEVTIDFMLNLA